MRGFPLHIHGPFIDKGFVFAPGATNFGVHDDLRMRKEDVEIERSIFIFVTKITSFVVSFRKGRVYGFEVDEGFIDGVDEILG